MPAPMTSIVLLNTHSPSQMASDLTLSGFIVWEALSVSEVLHLCEMQNIDAVVIAHGVEEPELIAVQIRRITGQPNAGKKAGELIWELSRVVGAEAGSIP